MIKQSAIKPQTLIRLLAVLVGVGFLGLGSAHADLRSRHAPHERRPIERLTEHIRRARARLERAEAHHRTLVADRIDAHIAHMRARRSAILARGRTN